MIYCSFGETILSERLRHLHALLVDRAMKVGEVIEMLIEYCELKKVSTASNERFTLCFWQHFSSLTASLLYPVVYVSGRTATAPRHY